MYIAKITDRINIQNLPVDLLKYSLVKAEIIFSNDNYELGQSVVCIDTMGVNYGMLVLLDKFSKNEIDGYTIDKEIIAIISKTKYIHESVLVKKQETYSDLKTVVAELLMNTIISNSNQYENETISSAQMCAEALIDEIYSVSSFKKEKINTKEFVEEIFLREERKRNKGK